MDEMNTVKIEAEKYAAILKLAFSAAILKDALFSQAALSYDGKSLIFGLGNDVSAIAEHIFPEEYAEKIAELRDERVGE